LGKDITAQGVVSDSVWSPGRGAIYIQFRGDYPTGNGLICLIDSADKKKFDEAFGGDAAGAFAGTRLRVSGKPILFNDSLHERRGWPQIDLHDPSQVRIIEPRPLRGKLSAPVSAAARRPT